MRLGRTAVAGVLVLAGVTCVTVALTTQRHAPTVPLAAESPTQPPAPAPPSAAASPPLVLPTSVPTRIEIPAIGVRSSLLRLGQAADGSLAVPPPGPTFDRAGWYRYSPTPGALGPAVIVGHVDSAEGGPSVFFRLGDLRPRDTVQVTRVDGSVAVFAVDDVRRFAKADFPTHLVYGNTDHAALRLITCGGPFDRKTGRYLDNVVVTATLVRAA